MKKKNALAMPAKKGGGGAKRMLLASLSTPGKKKIFLLLSALVERFGVSHMRDNSIKRWWLRCDSIVEEE